MKPRQGSLHFNTILPPFLDSWGMTPLDFWTHSCQYFCFSLKVMAIFRKTLKMEKILKSKDATSIGKANDGFNTWSLAIRLEIGVISRFIKKYEQSQQNRLDFPVGSEGDYCYSFPWPKANQFDCEHKGQRSCPWLKTATLEIKQVIWITSGLFSVFRISHKTEWTRYWTTHCWYKHTILIKDSASS